MPRSLLYIRVVLSNDTKPVPEVKASASLLSRVSEDEWNELLLRVQGLIEKLTRCIKHSNYIANTFAILCCPIFLALLTLGLEDPGDVFLPVAFWSFMILAGLWRLAVWNSRRGKSIVDKLRITCQDEQRRVFQARGFSLDCELEAGKREEGAHDEQVQSQFCIYFLPMRNHLSGESRALDLKGSGDSPGFLRIPMIPSIRKINDKLDPSYDGSIPELPFAYQVSPETTDTWTRFRVCMGKQERKLLPAKLWLERSFLAFFSLILFYPICGVFIKVTGIFPNWMVLCMISLLFGGFPLVAILLFVSLQHLDKMKEERHEIFRKYKRVFKKRGLHLELRYISLHNGPNPYIYVFPVFTRPYPGVASDAKEVCA